jgi:hypothetical protein
MRIQKLTLKNCRSPQETVLEWDRLNFIRGRTAVGKVPFRWPWNIGLPGDAKRRMEPAAEQRL